MALHGDICVNQKVIGEWWAVRITNTTDTALGPDAVSKYRYEVWDDQDGMIGSGILEHRYGDGAAALAAAVLSGARIDVD